MRMVNLLSVVVPCHNEAEVLPLTHEKLNSILKVLRESGKVVKYEILYVDNGSTDHTLRILKDIFKSNPYVRVIGLRRNFGYQGSISAGLYYAKGDAVITIDADLQDPPEKIEEMLYYYQDGYDLVLGVRTDRSADSFIKKVFSENYYRLMRLLGVEIVHNHGDFRLMAKSLVREFNSLSERNRLIRAMILQLDSKYAIVHYKREPRRAGQSKFNMNSLFSLSMDGVISFSYSPLRLASFVGLLLCFISIVGVAWILYLRLSTNVIPGWASTLLPILALGGFQILMLGLIGEYIGRLYIEVKHRPLFVVREKLEHGNLDEGEIIDAT